MKNNKIALITGCTSGIGKALGLYMAVRLSVILGDIPSDSSMDSMVVKSSSSNGVLNNSGVSFGM